MQATRRRPGAPAWLGLALVIGLPALAEAQLFPNRTVTRQREACAAEPPFYSTVRHNYFGYYPTCWSRFPAGWGCPCPNPEMPNRVAEFEVRKRDPLPTQPPDTGIEDEVPGDNSGDQPSAMPGDDPRIPALPNPPGARAPFNRDSAPPDNVPGRNPPDGAVPPQTLRLPTPAVNPATSSTAQPSGTTALLEMPRITPPVASTAALEATPNAGSLALAPDATLTSNQPTPRPDLGALPAAPVPDSSTPATSELGSVDPTLLGRNQATTSGSPAQAPQRKGLFSGLFGSSKRRR